MFNGSIDILIMAIVAGFIAFRLYSILGKREDEEIAELLKKNQYNFVQMIQDANLVLETESKNRHLTHSDPAIEETLNKFKEIDVDFDDKEFIDNAKKAFEILLTSFSTANKDSLRLLLSKALYKNFEKIINDNEKNDRFPEKTLVSILSTDIISAIMDKSVAKITVKFISEQINLIRNKEKKIIDGTPSQIERIEDIWTFERNLASQNPSWTVIAV